MFKHGQQKSTQKYKGVGRTERHAPVCFSHHSESQYLKKGDLGGLNLLFQMRRDTALEAELCLPVNNILKCYHLSLMSHSSTYNSAI